MQRHGWTAVEVTRDGAPGGPVLVCEHASAAIPGDLAGLGLSAAARRSHAAWDIGALDVARALAVHLDAPLVAGGLSRLVYDCNRPPDAADAVPARSEVHEIPGNRALAPEARAVRVRRVHDPFHAALDALLDGRETSALITVHSFTPVWHGTPRALELGFLCHADAALAEAALAAERRVGRYRAALNQPYAPSDGVTYTLARHGERRGLPAMMIEIRNDLIATPKAARAMAVHLAPGLASALATLLRVEAGR